MRAKPGIDQLNLFGQQQLPDVGIREEEPNEAPKVLETHQEVMKRLNGKRVIFWKRTSMHRYPKVWAYSIPLIRRIRKRTVFKVYKGILNLKNGKFEIMDKEFKSKGQIERFIAFLIDNGCKEYTKGN